MTECPTCHQRRHPRLVRQQATHPDQPAISPLRLAQLLAVGLLTWAAAWAAFAAVSR